MRERQTRERDLRGSRKSPPENSPEKEGADAKCIGFSYEKVCV